MREEGNKCVNAWVCEASKPLQNKTIEELDFITVWVSESVTYFVGKAKQQTDEELLVTENE